MRLATKDDTVALSELEMELFPDNCLNETTLRNELEIGSCWIEEVDGKIAGYALVRKDQNLNDLLRLGVRRDYRRDGIGKKLLERVIFSDQPTMLTVQKDNDNALGMYLQYGFKIVGQITHAAWVMKREAT